MRGPFHGIRRFLRSFSRTEAQVARDVEAEVEFHLQMKASELEAGGLDPSAAAHQARRAFGDVERATHSLVAQEASFEQTRRRAAWLDEWRRDAAHTIRQVRRAPAFALLVVVTLGLGIGATTAIFSAVHAILLAPLPYTEPDRLVRVMRETPDGPRQSASGGDFLEFQREAKSLNGLTSYYMSTANLAGVGEPQRVVTSRVSSNFFDVLGVRPMIGRNFVAAEDQHGAAEVALVSEGAWRRLFGGDAAIVGTTIRMDRQSVQIIGIMPETQRYPANTEFWLPAKHEPEMMADDNRGASWLRLVGRLAPGVTIEQANAEFRVMSKGISERFPADRTGVVSTLSAFADTLVGDVRQPLWVLLGAVGMVLLIACTNVAALLLGRLMAREGELTVRTALGAGRGRLVRQLLTECTTLGLIGAGVGVALATGLVKVLVALAPDIPRLADVRVNGLVLAFSIVLGLGTGLVFGVIPAWHVSRRDLQHSLRGGGRGLVGTRQAGRVRGALVVGQFALAIVLLVGAGLLIRTFSRLRSVDPGFDAANVTTFTLTLPQDGSFDGAYGGTAGQRQFLRNVLPRLEAIPGVEVAGASLGLPLSERNFTLSFEVEGRPKPPVGQEPESQVRITTPGFLEAMGIPVLRGRGLQATDLAEAPPVVVVSEQFASRYFPGEDVLGKRVTFGWERDSAVLGGEVVGVARDTKHTNLTADAIPMAYFPADQWPVDEYSFVLKSKLPVGVVAAQAARVVKEVDAELPLYDIQSAEQLFNGALVTTRFYLTLLAVFAALALVLASLGIYGVVSFGVQQRRREIGIRMALGASVGNVQGMVVRQGLRLAAFGVVIGVVGAFALSGLLRGVLYGVQPTDPLTFIAVIVILTVAALLACVLPARRASRIDPQRAIRVE
ncbi:MAG: ABC transporter permease [Cytophagaceae bacterium]|nr:ABC transporter permease [Gemmatimonadaceae bacterium]